jgi:hypothetical protein
MPRLSVFQVRAAMIYLLLGFGMGGLLLSNKGMPFAGWVWSLLPAHIEFLVIGWTAQLAMGVAFWILPRYPGGSRGSERIAWISAVLLNAGVIFAAGSIFEPLLLPIGRVLQTLAAFLFALAAWGRVKPLVKP